MGKTDFFVQSFVQSKALSKEDMAQFHELCLNDPDTGLSTIATIFEQDEDLKLEPVLRLLRSAAYFKKAANLTQSEDNQPSNWNNDAALDLLEESLIEFKLCQDLREALNVGEALNVERGISDITEIFEVMESAAGVLEIFRPGKVQERWEETKLKYFADRVSINQKCAPHLIPSDEAMNTFGDVFFSFPHIVRSAFVFYMTMDDEQRHYINVALFEESTPKNAFGEANPIIGYVNLYQDGTFNIELADDEVKKAGDAETSADDKVEEEQEARKEEPEEEKKESTEIERRRKEQELREYRLKNRLCLECGKKLGFWDNLSGAQYCKRHRR